MAETHPEKTPPPGREPKAAYTDKTIEFTESDDEAVVGKTARIVEEVVIRKDVSDRVEVVKDTIRREEVEIGRGSSSGARDFSPAKVNVMAEPTREEYDAKLQVAEARTETRFVELNAKLDRILDGNTSLAGQLAEVKSDNKATRTTVIIVVIASVLAGLAAFWEAQNNTLAAFSAGLSATGAK